MRFPAVRARRSTAVMSFGALVLSTGICRADLSVVSQVTVNRGTGQPVTKTVTTSFHGSVVRTETDRLVSLFDGGAHTLTTLDKANRTYQMRTLRDTGQAAGLLSKINFKAQAHVEPKAETRVIAGKRARRYVGHATITMDVSGLPGASASQTQMEIEEWAAASLPRPASLDKSDPALRLVGSLETMRGMEPLVRELGRVKGMPLMCRISITPASNGQTKPTPIVTETRVVSLAQSPLSASLFRVPSGYRRVEPAPMPSTNGLRTMRADRGQ